MSGGPSFYYMGEVARLGKVLSNAEKNSPGSEGTEAIRTAFLIARKRYTNPFNINKWE